MTHLTLTVAAGLLLAIAVALSGGARTARESGDHAAWIFFTSMASVIAGSWIMFLIHG